MKSCLACADVHHVMDPKDTQHVDPDRRSTERDESPVLNLDSLVAISATDLIEQMRSGQGQDVNELINRAIQDRQAA
ncbi:MAG: hypothetical protein ACWA5W_00475 [Phycisphaerales bacterium]